MTLDIAENDLTCSQVGNARVKDMNEIPDGTKICAPYPESTCLTTAFATSSGSMEALSMAWLALASAVRAVRTKPGWTTLPLISPAKEVGH